MSAGPPGSQAHPRTDAAAVQRAVAILELLCYIEVTCQRPVACLEAIEVAQRERLELHRLATLSSAQVELQERQRSFRAVHDDDSHE